MMTAKHSSKTPFSVYLSFCLMITGLSSTAAAGTPEDLMAAYNGESNANAKYLAYATKADKEGYGKVASLFRAAAKAESIHAQHHADAITKLKGTPKNDIKLPAIKSTKENLQDAVKGESYERDTMYPDFIKQAKKEKNETALTSYNYALKAEAEHAKLYKQAIDNLNDWKTPTSFYVCPVCGYTVPSIAGKTKCPVCQTNTAAFIDVK